MNNKPGIDDTKMSGIPSSYDLLCEAIRQGKVRKVNHLLKVEKVNPNPSNNLQSEDGTDPQLRLAARNNVDSALNIAVSFGNLKIVQLLLEYGAKITHDDANHPTKFAAVAKGRSVILDQLLQFEYNHKGDNVNWTDYMIELAVIHNQASCLAVLLRWGIYRYKPNKLSPCGIAAYDGKTIIMKLLIKCCPWILQEGWFVKGLTLPTLTKYNKEFTVDLIAARKQPPQLAIICRFNIIQQLGYSPLQKVEKLPLPLILKEYLESLFAQLLIE